MNRVNIYRTAPKEQTMVANLFIDEYMADANDAQLKIYLFLIRMMNANLPTSVTDIADKFNYTEKDVLRALMYWESRQLLALDFDASNNLSGIEVLSLENNYEVQKTTPRITPVMSFTRPAGMYNTTSPVRNMNRPAARSFNNPCSMNAVANTSLIATNNTVNDVQPVISKPEYSLDDIKSFKNNEDAEQLIMVAEQYIGRPLTKKDMETVLFFYDRLSFSTDLIDYLIQHCVERGKKDFRYIEKVALSWHEQGIKSPKDAQNSAKKYDSVVYAIMKSLGKNSSPAPKELEYINRWTKEYGFLLDVIQEACDKTVLTTDNNRFAYADGILRKWHDAGVRHKADIALADASFNQQRTSRNTTQNQGSKNKFNSFSQNTYDFDELEETILSN